VVASLFRAGHDRVVLDSYNQTRKSRSEWKSDRWNRVYHTMHTKSDACMEVARREKDEEIQPIIAKMAAEFEPVQADEWDEIQS
jgi:hypothetical protein